MRSLQSSTLICAFFLVSGCGGEGTGPGGESASGLAIEIVGRGTGFDPDGLTVSIKGPDRRSGRVTEEAPLVFGHVRQGAYEVILRQWAPHCWPAGLRQESGADSVLLDATVQDGRQTRLSLDLFCFGDFLTVKRPPAGGRSDLLYVGPDGSERILSGVGREGSPTWSSDGSTVAFLSDRTGNDEVYVIPFNGGSERQLTDWPGRDWNPLLSADGSMVAFERWDPPPAARNARIFVVDIPSMHTVEVSAGLEFGRNHTWSPDGLEVAFESADWGPNNVGVFATRPDGSGRRALNPRPGYDRNPKWSPDGRRILFRGDQPDDSDVGDAWVMDADGSNARRVTTGLPLRHCDWMPAGDLFFCRELVRNSNTVATVILNLEGFVVLRLDDVRAVYPIPGGEYLFGNRVGELFVISLDGAIQYRLAIEGITATAIPNPKSVVR